MPAILVNAPAIKWLNTRQERATTAPKHRARDSPINQGAGGPFWTQPCPPARCFGGRPGLLKGQSNGRIGNGGAALAALLQPAVQ